MLLLPEELRSEVRKPFGEVLIGDEFLNKCRDAAKPLIAVGDYCAYELIKNKIEPDIIIFDFKIKRIDVSKEIKETIAPHARNAIVVVSQAGTMSDDLILAVEKILGEGKGAIFIAGEDDLSSLLVMAKAKKGVLAYGQPNEGGVFVPLGGKKTMENALGMLNKMIRA